MAGKRNIKRRRGHKIHIKKHKIVRRNQRGGIPLPLIALGAGLLTPIIADGVKDLIKRLGA